MSEKVDAKFCQHLGKLFYAIAAVDKNVRPEEFNKLKEVLDNEWTFLDDASICSKATIIDTFEWLHLDNEYNAEVCYNNFMLFKRNNEALFSSKMKSLILQTASKIATSFSGQNKSELMMLAKLSIEFKK
ncbi:hypothetical protein [Psychroserpens luteolus]|uniref:hypothetical protein n=1 Tax=Psychroserpens luteolus TaxID=2855840 RepID=UPI001E29B2D0|nr:hypothetical protein [Psychroserpens luteolus]MCD2259617.1 hypothetical protein [Psychroserpens luteolus]